MLNKSEYQMTKIDSAVFDPEAQTRREPSINSGPELVEGLVAGRNMFRTLEN
jgi:hypothetical protein